jgi:hypothetical protein
LAALLTSTFEDQQVDQQTQGQPAAAGQPAPGSEGAGAATEPGLPSSETPPLTEEAGGEPAAGAQPEAGQGGEPTEAPQGEPAGDEPLDTTEGAEPGEQTPAGAEKRIKRLLAQVHDLETRLESAQRQTANRPPPGPSPLDSITDPNELAAREANARAGLREAQKQLRMVNAAPRLVENYLRQHGVVLQDEQGNEDFSPERMSQVLSNAEDAFYQTLEAVPARRQFLQEYDKAHAQVVKVIPWVADKVSENYAYMQQIAAQFPGLKAVPNWEYWTACAINGHNVIQQNLKRQQATARAGTNGTTRNGRPAARGPVTGAAPSAPPRTPPEAARVNKARERVLKEGSRSSLSEYFQATNFVK